VALIFALAVTPVAGYSLYQSGIFDQAGNIIRRLGDEADWLGREIDDVLFDSRRLVPAGGAIRNADDLNRPQIVRFSLNDTPSGGDGIGRTYPNGFNSQEEFISFGQDLKNSLAEAGYRDVEPVFAGSSVTGMSYRSGEPFDLGRTSDFDIAIISPSLMDEARELGIDLRSRGTRTGPLDREMLRELGLFEVFVEFNERADRPVSFMIYESIEALSARNQPFIRIPNLGD
jgi:hypothetical protein